MNIFFSRSILATLLLVKRKNASFSILIENDKSTNLKYDNISAKSLIEIIYKMDFKVFKDMTRVHVGQ